MAAQPARPATPFAGRPLRRPFRPRRGPRHPGAGHNSVGNGLPFPGTARREFIMSSSRPRLSLLPGSQRVEQLEARDTPAFAVLPPFTAGVINPTVLAAG